MTRRLTVAFGSFLAVGACELFAFHQFFPQCFRYMGLTQAMSQSPCFEIGFGALVAAASFPFVVAMIAGGNEDAGIATLGVAFGAVSGSIAGYAIEKSNLLDFFTGHPSIIVPFGQVYERPFSGTFTLAAAVCGAVAGFFISRLLARR